VFNKLFSILLVVTVLFGLLFVATPVNAETVCTPTGYIKDGINLTAALINPTSLTGDVDASGCNIGVYYDQNLVSSAEILGADIFGANYFGVLVNGDAGDVQVNIKNSSIHDIGESPLNGAQHGVAIYYMAFNEYSVTGMVENNTIYHYQKNGITVNGSGADVVVIKNVVTGEGRMIKNVVTGEGRIDYTAQNGIQFAWGAMGKITGNEVSGNYYDACEGPGKSTCEWVAAGILLYQANPLMFKGMALKSTNDIYDNQYNVLIVK